MIQDVNDQKAEQMISSPGVIGLLVHNHGSIPCRHFKPEFEAVVGRFADRIAFYRLEAQENPSMAERLGVTHVPTLILFKDAEQIARYEGPYSQEALIDRIGRLLGRRRTRG